MQWALFGGLALLALAGGGKAVSMGDTVVIPASTGRAAVVAAGQSFGLPEAWVLWLVWTARGESGWKITAHNDSAKESAAALKAYNRLVSEGRWNCPHVVNVYAIGSGGWYGQLAPYTVLWGEERGYGCDPIAIWRDPSAGTRIHLVQARGVLLNLLSQLPPEKRTWLHLRALYGLPSRINEPASIDNPERRAQYGSTLQKAGIHPAFLDQLVPPMGYVP